MLFQLALAQINLTLGDFVGNSDKIFAAAERANHSNSVLITPELALAGYPPEDLVLRPDFQVASERAFEAFQQRSKNYACHFLLGHTHRQLSERPAGEVVASAAANVPLSYNAVSLIRRGDIMATYHKCSLPNVQVFDEVRHFLPGTEPVCRNLFGVNCGLAICEDIWNDNLPTQYHALGVQLLLVVNASPLHLGKIAERQQRLIALSARFGFAIVYVNLVGGQDELVFDGASLVIAQGQLRYCCPQFAEGVATVDVIVDDTGTLDLQLSQWQQISPPPFPPPSPLTYPPSVYQQSGDKDGSITGQTDAAHSVRADLEINLNTKQNSNTPSANTPNDLADNETPRLRYPLLPTASAAAEAYCALVMGVRDYVHKNRFPGVMLGLSGGIDSALTLTVAVDALGADAVEAVMMPSPYTSAMSLKDSQDLVDKLGVKYHIIPIETAVTVYESMLTPYLPAIPAGGQDTTFENIQARIRGNLLMALSNRSGRIVLTTGNKSEMAVGYATLYGDMAGGYAVIKDIYKTFVYHLARYRNSIADCIPENILIRPPTAELRPNQTDQDSLPPYEILDAIVVGTLEQGLSVAELIAAGLPEQDVRQVLRLLRIAEYKRRQAPIGIRVTACGFGRDWRYPITCRFYPEQNAQ